MTAAKLTVAVLARNRPHFLRTMLDSLAAAATPDTTVLVRDHSDDDRCIDVVADVGATTRLDVHHVHARPRGQLENVLGAVKECETEFLSIVSDDDVCRPSFIRTLLPPLQADEAASFSTGNVECIDSEGQVLRRNRMPAFTERGYRSFELGRDRAEFFVVRREFRPFMGTIVRTDALRGLELPVEGAGMPDLWFAHHFCRSAVRGWCTDETLFQYRLHGETVSGEASGIDGYRWSIRQFQAEEDFEPFRSDLEESLQQFERAVLLGRFVRGERSRESRARIVANSRSLGLARQLATRLALSPSLAPLTSAYLRRVNPRLQEIRTPQAAGSDHPERALPENE